ncbi:ubiquitin-specific protease [Thraustotheca clavata]|uniref:Ubiquitin-specific protease n=1 Tax=Thraustotheca clavata TaxID=74557 RepID=A0A1V9YSY1_9STRA|nr:ubiquitin-specific protease [Thraustotheca clavata]
MVTNTFRLVTLDEAIAAHDIEVASYPHDEAASLQQIQSRIQQANDYFLGVYDDNNQLLGFVNGTLTAKRDLEEETMSCHDPNGKYLCIHSVVVSQAYRGQGIAKKLLKAYVARVIDKGVVSAIVLIAKPYLVHFYISCGFIVTRLSPVVHGNDAWMELVLDCDKARELNVVVVDAFASKAYEGNPAAVVVMSCGAFDVDGVEKWMQLVAMERNLSETTFVAPLSEDHIGGNEYRLRWFTPVHEVNLCGHGTLATSYVLYEDGCCNKDEPIHFHTRSGKLTVQRVLLPDGESFGIEMNFPTLPKHVHDDTWRQERALQLIDGLDIKQTDILAIEQYGPSVLCHLTLDAFEAITPDFTLLATIFYHGIIVTCAAPDSSKYDFYTRFFCPRGGVNEDPVTGSAHCALTPYWNSAYLLWRSTMGMPSLLEVWRRFLSVNGPMLDENALKETGMLLSTCVDAPEAVAASLTDGIDAIIAKVKQDEPHEVTNATLLLLQLIKHTYSGLKIAKRFECLDIATSALVPALLQLIEVLLPVNGLIHADAHLSVETLSFLGNVLLGYQHSSSLYQKYHCHLVQLAESIGQHPQLHDTALGSTLGQLMVLIAASLIRLNPGALLLNAELQKSVALNLNQFAKPSSSEIDICLRENAWILSTNQEFLPSIEGLWELDEFNDATTASKNAGSVHLQRTNSCHAVPFTSTLYGDDGNKKYELSGTAVSPLDLLQSTSKTHDKSWYLQGHWHQILESNAPNTMQSPNLTATSEWSCKACTVVNVPTATKCSTCGAAAPPAMPSALNELAFTSGSNPAPFSAILNDRILSIQWSRGDQKGTWLARRYSPKAHFALPTLTSELSAMVYNLTGDTSQCLVVEKNISVQNHLETTFECHFLQNANSSAAKQAIVGNGQFALSISVGNLVWEYGRQVLSVPLPSTEEFVHVALVWNTTELILVLNGEISSRSPRSRDQEEDILAKHFVIGARPVDAITPPASFLQLPTSKFTLEDGFHGSIVEVRLWSNAQSLENIQEQSNQVSSKEHQHLMLYLPLVGPYEHLLIDHGPHGNHATKYDSAEEHPVTRLQPNSSLPVLNHLWSVIDGVGVCGAVSTSPDHDWTLHSGSALWYEEAVDFQTNSSLQIAIDTSFAMSTKTSLCFALATSSFWSLASLIDEVSLIELPENSFQPPSKLTALFINVVQQQDSRGCSIGIYVWKGKSLHCLSTVSSMVSPVTSINVQYDYARGTLGVLLNQCLISLMSIDIPRILGVNAQKPIRTGIICPKKSDIEDSTSVSVSNWTIDMSAQESTSYSAIREVYNIVDNNKPASVEDHNTISCSKFHTDGSAITQELYGCQSCNTSLVFCKTCAALCHEGHELVYKGKSSGACGCRSRGANSCSCPEPVPLPEGKTSLGEPVFNLWYCPKCTVINPVSSARCSVCAETSTVPNPPSHEIIPAPVQDSGSSSSWTCDACTMVNDAAATKCFMCETAKPGGDNSRLLALANYASNTIHSQVEVAGPSGPWTCTVCTLNNDEKSKSCAACGTARVVDAIPIAAPVASTNPTPSPAPQPTESAPTTSNNSSVEMKQQLQQLKLQRYPLDISTFNDSATVWETTEGILIMNYNSKEAFIGDVVCGTYQNTEGTLVGLLKTLESGSMDFRGKYKTKANAVENSLIWHFGAPGRFDGYWYRGDGSGPWRCKWVSATAGVRGLNSAPFYTGLINMEQNLTNVCYQNSFLQLLFSTQAFRVALLSQSSPTPLVETLRQLFTQLLASQSPAIATHALQRCLPSTFKAGRQQDTCDFAHFLMDSFGSSTLEGDVSRIFGGQQATIRRCKSCNKTSSTDEYFWELLLNMVDLRYTPITDISAVTGTSLKIPCPAGYDRLNFDLNKDRANAPYVYLCTQRDTNALPITDILVRVTDITEPKPTMQGYSRVEVDLNMGGSAGATINLTTSNAKGPTTGVASSEQPRSGVKKQIHLFFSRDPKGSPITDLAVIYGTNAIPDGFRQIRVDLNQGDGTPVYLCYRCDMPITDLKLVTEGVPGFKLLDQSLHLAPNEHQYIAHTDGGHGPCVTGLRLVSPSEADALKKGHWEDLKLRSKDKRLMIQRGHGNPLYAIEVFRAPRMVPKYSDYEVITLDQVVSKPFTANSILGLWRAGDDCDRAKRAVNFHSITPITNPTFHVQAKFDKKGVLTGIAQFLSATQTYALVGHWQDAQTKLQQVAHLLFRKNALTGGVLEGTIGDSNGKNVIIRGNQVTSEVSVQNPITAIVLIRKHELAQLPDGVQVLPTEINSDLCLGVRRDPNELPVKDVCVVYGDVDPVPDDFLCVQTTIHGMSANLNEGSQGLPLFVCYKCDSVPSTKGISDLMILTSNEAPEGFTKIAHTPLGMEANLQTGKTMFLAYKRADDTSDNMFVDHPLNGLYETSIWGKMDLVVLSQLESCHEIQGKCGFTVHDNAAALRGFVYCNGENSWQSLGFWEPTYGQFNSLIASTYSLIAPLNASSRAYCLNFTLDGTIPVTSGFWTSSNTEGGKWNLVKDCYIHVGYKKDYGSEWANGALVYSDRISSHAIPSLLHRFVSPRTLGGDFTCGECHERVDSRVSSVIVTPPSHLVLTLKRMHYDWRLQTTCKSLYDVTFAPYLELPSLSDEDAAVVNSSNINNEGSRHYGLYGVLVHSGVSANSGHYYSYCRPSSASNLQLENDPNAPWIKFNDKTLTVSSWEEMNEAMMTSVSDSVYLLFYKRLDNIVHTKSDHEEVKSDDDESMLLAKAMALSMSSAQASPENLHEEQFAPETQLLLNEIENDNTQLTRKALENWSSTVSIDELHAAILMKNSIPEPYKGALIGALAL